MNLTGPSDGFRVGRIDGVIVGLSVCKEIMRLDKRPFVALIVNNYDILTGAMVSISDGIAVGDSVCSRRLK